MFTQSKFLKQSLYSSEKQYNKQQNILGPHLQHTYFKVFNSLGIDTSIQYNTFKEMEGEMLVTDVFYAF